MKLKKQKLATVTIRNASSTERLRVTVTPPVTPFSLQAAIGTVDLMPGEVRNVGVLFIPRKKKAYTGKVAITSSDLRKPKVNVKLTGSGK